MAVELRTLVDGTISVRDKRTFRLLGRIVPIKFDRYQIFNEEVYGKTIGELAERIEKATLHAPNIGGNSRKS